MIVYLYSLAHRDLLIIFLIIGKEFWYQRHYDALTFLVTYSPFPKKLFIPFHIYVMITTHSICNSTTRSWNPLSTWQGTTHGRKKIVLRSKYSSRGRKLASVVGTFNSTTKKKTKKKLAQSKIQPCDHDDHDDHDNTHATHHTTTTTTKKGEKHNTTQHNTHTASSHFPSRWSRQTNETKQNKTNKQTKTKNNIYTLWLFVPLDVLLFPNFSYPLFQRWPVRLSPSS